MPHLTRRLTLVSAALLLAAATAWASERVRVPTIEVQAAGASATQQLEGTVQAMQEAVLAAQVPGTVTGLLVQAGDRVKAGQVLLRIDDRATAASVAQSSGGLAQAQAAESQARLHLQRTRDLNSKGFVSAAALDMAQAQWQAAHAGVQAAQAGQQQARLQQQFTQAVAPFDGVVQTTHVQVGDLAHAGRPLVTVYAPGALRVVVQVPASLRDAASGSSQIELRPNGQPGASLKPASQQLLPVTDATTQTSEWRLNLPTGPQPGWWPGQSVQVRFGGARTGQVAAGALPVLVPSAAVLRRGELTAVYVAREGQFQLQPVRVRPHAHASMIEVLSGLRAGDRIATDAVRAGLAGAQPEAR